MDTTNPTPPGDPVGAAATSARGDDADIETPATVTVEIDASPAEVWEALTDDELEAWFGDGAVLDPVPGGAIEGPDVVTGRPREGRVADAEPNERLRFEWWPTDDPAERSLVTIELDRVDEATRVTITEIPLVPVAAVLRATSAVDVRSAWIWRAITLRLAAVGVAARAASVHA